MGKDDYEHLPLFQTKLKKVGLAFKLYGVSTVVGILSIFVYRITNIPNEREETLLLGVRRWAWFGMLLSELWFSFYWFLTMVLRSNPTFRYPLRDRFSLRYEESLPGVDIFVCTADPIIEPPTMVINTVLSVMAYDYPKEKLSVYLSDDGGSELTFYALLEAMHFSKKWLPFCNNFKVEPMAPEAYFRSTGLEILQDDPEKVKEWSSIKKSYEEMKERIEYAMKIGRVPDELRKQHKGFQEWELVSSKHDHQTIIQILIDGREAKDLDIEGQPLPTLVYLAREKRPQYHHNFKAGAMNALLRVSSKISNGSVVLNVDCDMYANNSQSIRDALCFFMDEGKGHEIGYVQFPQCFENLTKNDIYSSSMNVIGSVEVLSTDGNGGPLYIGTGCFHRRLSLTGQKYTASTTDLIKGSGKKAEESASILEETCKVLASCSYEQNTEWGKEMGLKYGCPVEDIITGLAILCRGWKSIFYSPQRKAFLGVAPTTLLQSLVQHKRWSEGDFQIFLSKYNPFFYGHNKISLKLQLSYSTYFLWAPNCMAVLYYIIVPSLCLVRGITLFPKISNPWAMPFIYVIFTNRLYGLVEFVKSDGTLKGWWNDQRMWMFKRISSYFFAVVDNVLKLSGFTKSAFAITAKVADEDVLERYEKEMMEFGATSPMFTIIATLGLLNAFTLLWVVTMIARSGAPFVDLCALQIGLCSLLVAINLPVYEGLFFRKDKGRMPSSVTLKAVLLALLACSVSPILGF